MSRGTAFAVLLAFGSCDAYMVCVQYAENVPDGHSDLANFFYESPNAYARIFPPGSHGAGSKGDTRISDTAWSKDIQKVTKPDGSISWFNKLSHQTGYCTDIPGKSVHDELEYDSTSAIAVEVWHNKLSPVQDRAFDQKFGTCQLPLDKEHPYYHSTWQDRDVEHITDSNHCVILDHHACDGALLSSTSFHLKMCIYDHAPPPNPPPPSPPPPPPDCVCPAGFQPKGNPMCEPIHTADSIHEESTAFSMGETRYEDGRTASTTPGPALLVVGAIGLLFTGFMGGKSYGKNKSEPAAGMM